MEFRFSDDELAFREDLNAFLEAELPPGWTERVEGMGRDGSATDELWQFTRAFQKKLSERGWLTLAWPREFGGGGAGYIRQALFTETMAYHRAPVYNQGVDRVGPTLMMHGTTEQQELLLPQIRDAEIMWCQGFSEPGSGSDLASLQTRAVRDGDDYVINGQKIWTTHAHQADWIFALTRTEPDAPKHRGISFLLMDIRTPGITVRPLVNMGWQHEFNETFFEDVRVPADQRVGEEHRGWYVAMTLLDHERSNVTGAVAAQRQIRRLVEFAAVEGETRSRLGRGGEGDALRQQLAQLAIESEVLLTFSLRIISMQRRGQVPNYEASVSKIFGEALDKSVARTGTKLFGLHANLWDPDDPRTPMMARHTHNYCFTVARSIGGGTSEIQRNVIATRGLGLPRG